MIKHQYKLIFFLFCLSLVSCGKDFLALEPTSQLTTRNFYSSADNLKAGTAPLYCTVWFDYNTRPSYVLGDIRAGDLYAPYGNYNYDMFTESALDAQLSGAWGAFYKVVSQSTTVMNNINNYATGVTEAEKKAAIAECRFMRATAYFYLVRAWGNVPIVDDVIDLVKDYKIPTRSIDDVYKYIVRDLSYASVNLPKVSDKGRVNKWSAEGMLAKVYLAHSGYGSTNGKRLQNELDSAKKYAEDVCLNSGLSLLPNYADLYKYKFNNNVESLFSLQWVPLGEWGTQNATLSDFAYSSDLTGGVMAWGSTTASYDMLSSYEPGDTIRRNATFLTAGSKYPEINIAKGGYTYKGSFNDQGWCTTAHFKKYVPGGPNDDNDGKVAQMNSPLNTYILRLSDVYLTLAEASLGNDASLSGGNGLSYFNKVRARAQMPFKTSITIDDIIKERRIEFALEAQNWYNMVTWSYYMPNKILDMINNQNREASYMYQKDKFGNIVSIKTDKIQDNPVNAKIANMYFAVPESEAIMNPMLKQTPVPYTFQN